MHIMYERRYTWAGRTFGNPAVWPARGIITSYTWCATRSVYLYLNFAKYDAGSLFLKTLYVEHLLIVVNDRLIVD